MEIIVITALVAVIILQLVNVYERRQKDKEFIETIKEQARLIKAENLQDFVVMSPETITEAEEKPDPNIVDIEDLTPDILNEDK